MNWTELGLNWSVLADKSGLVLGEVKQGYRTWTATANGAILGSYLTEDQAKRAVELRVKEQRL